MASWEVLAAFAVTTLIIAYVPGPALIYAAAQTIARGRQAGLMAALGIHMGCYVHVIAAAFGLSAIFKHVPELYAVIKTLGALYLIWIGIGILRTKLDGATVAMPSKSTRRALVDSFMVEVLNPKVALFFIALLPQFVDPAGAVPVWAQFLILGTIVNFANTSADLCAVYGASRLVERAGKSMRALTLGRWGAGGAMIGLGVKLAADRS